MATVVEVGGGLREYAVGTRHLVDGYRVDEPCLGARGALLVPWPGPLDGGVYEFEGTEYRVPLTRGDAATHGLAQQRRWTVVHATADEAWLRVRLGEDPGYPFSLRLEVRYRLTSAGLDVELHAENVGVVDCPYAAGAHPYVTTGTARRTDVLVEVPALSSVGLDGAGRSRLSAKGLDPTAPRPLAELPLGLYTDLVRDGQGRATLHMRDPATGAGVSVWADQAFRYLRLYAERDRTGDDRRAPDGLAVEPWTSPAQALRSKRDLVLLAPGERHRARWGIGPSA